MKQVIKKKIKDTYDIDVKEPTYTLIVDGNSLMKRELVRESLNADGVDYGMVIQSLKVIGDVLSQRNFSHCYFFMDGDGSGILRAYEYKDYKANRGKMYFCEGDTEYDRKLNEYAMRAMAKRNKDNAKRKKVRGETEDESFIRQRTLLEEMLETLCVRTMRFEGVEGDDLVAYYVNNKDDNEYVYIISGDRDLTQLIRKDVAIYIVDKKKYVSKKNDITELGIPCENVILKKILCGDESDNIKGIKGLGETTLLKYFPEIKERPMAIEEIIDKARKINEDRTKEKKKPLAVCTNIVERITEGRQGKDIYEVNKRIIDLSEPFLTDEAKKKLDENIGAPLDFEGRDYKTLYKLIKDNKIYYLSKENIFSSIFSPYLRLYENEKKFSEEN